MPTSPSSTFRKSLLAVAILAATGCASTAPDRGLDGGQRGIMGGLADAGRATADVTARAWHRTGYLLGLHDDGGENDIARPPMDEVDLAMLEEDAPMPGEPGFAAPVRTDSIADVERAIVRPSAARIVATAPATVETLDGQPLLAGDGELVALETAPLAADTEGLAVARFVAPTDEPATLAALEPALEPATDSVALDDYTHVVGETETLWDIAKLTTGDATNWHVLADVNDLAPNAAVYPGQGLVIPADMVKPELALGETAPARPAAPADTVKVVAAAPAPSDAVTERLSIPAAADASPVAPLAELPSDDARGFEVRSGESLWEFAKRTTGDATYWQAIAAHNGFDEKRAVAVRAGEEIFVPEVLVRPELADGATQVASAAEPVVEPLEVDAPDTSRMVPIAEASAALPADAAEQVASAAGEEPASILDETRDIKIVEAAFRAEESGVPAVDAPAEIMISGTYYPKAIYNDADFSSSLLMRVSPGTRLKVANVDGPWYAVETDDGIGYVHDRDIK